MQRYPVRATHRARLEPAELERLLAEAFGSSRRDGESAVAEFGAIDRLAARGEKKELIVDVTMRPKVSDDVARDTIGRYNRFLESATGFNAKERARRMRKSAGDGG